jgi:hypothetical protein
MLGHTRGDERMGDLEEHCGAASEQRHEWRVADLSDNALGREVPIPTRQPLGVRP